MRAHACASSRESAEHFAHRLFSKGEDLRELRLHERDFVGILKLTFSLMLLIGIERKQFAIAGGIGIAASMACAFVMHNGCVSG